MVSYRGGWAMPRALPPVSSALILALLLLASSSGTSDAFVGPSSTRGGRRRVGFTGGVAAPGGGTSSGGAGRTAAADYPVLLRLTTVPAVEEDEMTEHDEEVLFGESPNGVPYPAHHRRKSRTGAILPDRTLPASTLALDHSTKDPLINKLRTMRDTLTNCPSIWTELAEHFPDGTALVDEHMCDEKINYTFKQVEEMVRKSAAVFKSLGVEKGTVVSILGENSAMWLLADHGIQRVGGASAVRGADAPPAEIRYIYDHSDSAGVAVLQGPRLFKRLLADAEKRGMDGLGLRNDSHGPIRTVVLMHREKQSDEQIAEMANKAGITVKVFSDMMASVQPVYPFNPIDLDKDDLSTIVYTSGTTGNPKGVMLTHGNLLHQISHRLSPTIPYDESEPLPGESIVSILPVWHITERTFELWTLCRGSKVVYSSIRSFKKDLAKFKPEWLVLVPRVLEKVSMGAQAKFASGSAVAKTLVKVFTATGSAKVKHSKIVKGLVVGDAPPSALDRFVSSAIVVALSPLNALGDKLVWSKVRDGFGGSTKAIVSGGSALASNLESFYELCGINISVGYGLTECSPLIAHRRLDANLVTAGCVGQPTVDTELRVVDPERDPNGPVERPPLPRGQVGVVVARGPQVMGGYYKNPEATSKAIDRHGWFDTGDLGRINPATGDLILTGRCKDTIVLSNGENIEPVPIENAVLSACDVVDQICLTGQDGRSITAVAVLNPDELVRGGYLDKADGKKMTDTQEKVNDPTCTEEECEAGCAILKKVSEEMRSKKALKDTLLNEMQAATAEGFRPWERVGEVYITLEPFAMANGQLTQSYKVKRDSVMSRYGDDLAKM